MNVITLQREKEVKVILTLLFILGSLALNGQGDPFSYYYRIHFRDKGENIPGNYLSTDLLSERAINRRIKAGITVPDVIDIPVSREYINSIKSLGLTLHCTSKWMNTALFKSQQVFNTDLILSLPFVDEVLAVRMPSGKSNYIDKLDFTIDQNDPPPFDFHITMLKGNSLHSSGYNGKGILIAVLDGGFINADQIPSLANLHNRKGIIDTYDFVKNDSFVYSYNTHGTAVLSVLAGQIEGYIQGTAPGADFLLLRTEDTFSESAAEEDFWAAGAEFADSAGADIISSSLGYFNFDNPSLNYKYSDLDGNTIFVTRAADIAASKGILVVNSAGNERNKEWKHIIAPSDGDSVIAAGAVDGNRVIADFSSAGPSADRRIKPDNTALGVSVTIQTSVSEVQRGNGTSFSCPVLSGMTACLMQAVPDATNIEIINALHSSADRFLAPDSVYGYGIPDMVRTLVTLQNLHLKIPDTETIAGPNPTTGEIEVIFREPPEKIKIEIFTSSGVKIFNKNIDNYPGRSLRISALNNRQQGLYFLRLTTGTGSYLHKIIKLNR